MTAAHVTDPGFTKANVLTTFVTMESLLFAGLSVAIALSSSGALGRSTPVQPATLAWASAGTLSVVGIGAVFAWIDLFGGGHAGIDRLIEVFAILVGIVVQPVIAVLVACNIRRHPKHMD